MFRLFRSRLVWLTIGVLTLAGTAFWIMAAVERTPVGNRNNMLFWAMCTALRSGYKDLRPIAEAGLRSGQTAREVRATWRSAIRSVNADGDDCRSPAHPAPNRAGRAASGAERAL